jgi:CheY-like chemotaxis protein
MPKTLLLADDSVTIQKVVGITLANEDVELVTENNGDAALARAREITPDIVLADISMPGLNGYELCAAIKSEAQLAHVPVILLTGTFESYDEARTTDVGADGHIAKPFEAQALVDLVHSTLQRTAATRASAAAAPASPDLGQTVVTPLPSVEPAAALAPEPDSAERPVHEQSTVISPTPPGPGAEAGFAFADFSDTGAPSGEATRVFDAGSPVAAPADLGLVTPDTQETSAPADPLPSIEPLPDLDAASRSMSTPEPETAQTVVTPHVPPGDDLPDLSAMETVVAPTPSGSGEVDAVLYDETSFLDPRAALNESSTPEPSPVVETMAPTLEPLAQQQPEPVLMPEPDSAPEPPVVLDALPSVEPLSVIEPVTPEPSTDATIIPPTPIAEPIADEEQSDSQIFGAPLEDGESFSGPKTQQQVVPNLAAEEAHEASEPDFAWAEPIAASGESLTDPSPVPPSGDIRPEPLAPLAVEDTAPVETATPEAPRPTIDAGELHAALEKVAWEAFGPLSEQLVAEVVRKVEEVAWEVVPQMAERLIQEEIARLKGDSDD